MNAREDENDPLRADRQRVTPEPVEALVERVREALELVYREHFAAADDALAALTELAERVKAAETRSERQGMNIKALYKQKRAAEAQRDELVEALDLCARSNHNKAIELGLSDRSFEECGDPTCTAARSALAKVRSE